MRMTVELFDSIINTSQDCVFWKDKERRFLGVNQAFLDFYGFESEDVLIGKTDEDMGWHSDPEPYRQDELRVLSGESTYKVQGKCFIRGEERDIIASKRPLFEGDEIVGLVGSFIDITDVLRRQNHNEDTQVVYTIDDLRLFPYFDRLLDEKGLEEILDPLTGVISRVYSLDYVHSLITNRIPFSFAIVDLDNFKTINDTFGHGAGDTVLKEVTRTMAQYLGENGIVGRFGGDELLVVNLRDVDFAAKERFFSGLFESHSVVRRKVNVQTGEAYVTCTCGCASYPEDADDFAGLFDLIDKSLYIGKRRGRNCFIIYREETHHDIEMKNLARHSLCEDMVCVQKLFDMGSTLNERLGSVLPFYEDFLHIRDLYLVDSKGDMYSAAEEQMVATISDIPKLIQEDLYAASTIEDLEKKAPELGRVLHERDIESFMIVRMWNQTETEGYLICGVNRRFRKWQDNECAMLYFLSNLIRGI